MKKQVVVRTYPSGCINTVESLNSFLEQGYTVVMCNPFGHGNNKGNEYVLEKEFKESED